MSRRDFREGSCGREIIDEVVEKNKHKNMEIYESCKSMPKYMGCVNIGEPTLKLSHYSKKNTGLTMITLIAPLTKGVEYMQLNPGDAKIFAGDGSVVVEKNVYPTVIKIIKVATALSVNANADFSTCMVGLIDALCQSPKDCISLPLQLPMDTKTQTVISTQINDWLVKLFDKENVPYKAVIEAEVSEVTDGMSRILNHAKAGAPDVH